MKVWENSIKFVLHDIYFVRPMQNFTCVSKNAGRTMISTCWKNWLKWETLQPYAAVPSNAAISRDETIETIETDPKSPRAQGQSSHPIPQCQPNPRTHQPTCWIDLFNRWTLIIESDLQKKKGPEVAYSLLHNCILFQKCVLNQLAKDAANHNHNSITV